MICKLLWEIIKTSKYEILLPIFHIEYIYALCKYCSELQEENCVCYKYLLQGRLQQASMTRLPSRLMTWGQGFIREGRIK